MTDLGLLAGSLLILMFGFGGGILLHRWGLATTYVRDLIHVGTGVWVLTWPYWQSRWVPVLLPFTAWVATLCIPHLATKSSKVQALQRSLSDDDERWSGLQWYAASYTLWTAVAFGYHFLGAAISLWALSLGDGLGGAVGRHFGRWKYTLPNSKTKSVEGSLVVALMATCGAMAAGAWFGITVLWWWAVIVGLVAAFVEALAPRGSDNLLIPIGVWLTCYILIR